MGGDGGAIALDAQDSNGWNYRAANLSLGGTTAAPTLVLRDVAGSAGNDTLTGTAERDQINALTGADVISGLDGNDNTFQTLLAMLKSEGPQRWLMRKLQRFSVTLYARDMQRLLAQGDVEEILPDLYVQVGDVLYHAVFGVNVDEMPGDPATLVI